jgi:hypothetical protein
MRAIASLPLSPRTYTATSYVKRLTSPPAQEDPRADMKRFACALASTISLVIAASAGARGDIPRTITFIAPVTFVDQPLCGGEAVDVTGRQHSVIHVTTDSSGGQHLVLHTNYLDVRATGVQTGRIYVVTDVSNRSSNISGPPPLETTQTISSRIVGHGTPNTMVTIVFHFTINANGEVTSEVVKVAVRCGTGPQ